ncbi:MAG: lamin tail domain-containing protein [Akkermansiaceae bacterium]
MSLSHLRFLAPAIVMLPFSKAAEIDWQAPFNITSVNSIDTNGTLLQAVNATTDGNSPTVTVAGEAILFSGSPIGPANTNTGSFFTGGGGDTGNANLNTVLNSHSYGPGNDWSITLAGLTPGADYQIQLIGGGDTRGCCSARNQRAGDNESPENLSGDFSRSGVGSVIGTFTANGTTQTVNILPGQNNGVDPSLSAYILRSVAPPTPQAPTDLALDDIDLAPSTASGTLIGTLTTSDPNGDNEHVYQLVPGSGDSDNGLFVIANGDELRANANLGGFGSSYSVRIRTTDPDNLFREESFNLDVEAAATPTSIMFPTNTLLQMLPPGTSVADFSTTDPNVADNHTYQLVSGTGDTDNSLFTINGSTLTTNAPLPPLGSTLSFRVRSSDLSGLFIESTFTITIVSSSIRINEFLANNNDESLQDEDEDRPDWIELHNPAGGAVSLNGMYLTDDPGNLTKWLIPNVTLSGNGYLVIFASSKDRRPTNGDNLHTNFNLSAGGEYLALVAADGTTILSEFGSKGQNYPAQDPGVSYGFFGDPLQIGYMLNPTPDLANDSSSGVTGFVRDTNFSVSRGFFDAPFSLSISSATPGATIRYTTDGSWPSETSGTIYTGPITVDRTMAVKAIAYQLGFVSTNIDTHTYILVDSVAAQTASNTQSLYGLPSSWGGQSPYYGMNNNSNVNPATVTDDLKTVPSLSIALETNDMFGFSGIYSNPGSSGQSWERRTSLELIDPDDPSGEGNFQQYCAIRIQGGAFRSFGLTRKKSFRVIFKSQFGTSNQPTGGEGSLKFPLFGEEPGVAQEFQTLTFRMESNDGWQWSGAGGQPQYARDEFGRRVQLALGQPASHGRYLHLYINGVYWGLYNVVERPDASFAESYIEGADRDLWEGQNSGSPINDATNLNNWNSFRNAVGDISTAGSNSARDAAYLEACGFNPDGSRNLSFPIWCDPSNNADYFITNWYGGNSDWPNKNYYGGIDTQANRTGYKYFMWDSEWSLFLRSNTNYNRITDYRGIAAANDALQDSPEFRLRFADRAHRALFNDGPLTPTNARALYDEITAQHTSILNPEAARWGDQHGGNRSVSDWQNEYDRIVDDWFPVRGGNLLSSLRSADLYPDIDAPIYSQHGGSVPAGSGPSLIVPTSVTQVYYMYGGGDDDLSDYSHSLDPRLVGGAVNPFASLITLGGGGGGGPTTTVFIDSGDDWKYLDNGSNQGTAWRAAGFNDSSWASGPSQLGYGDGDEATVVSFGPSSSNKYPTTYFRKTFNIADPTIFENFTLNFTYDDSIVVYLNGTEVARENIGANPAFDDFANGNGPENGTDNRILQPSAFVSGSNTFAVEIHQTSSTSSDISFDLDLTGNPPGGGNTHSSAPLSLTEPGWLFSRSYNSATGEWSALNTAYFTPDTVSADASNLVISEFSYHPSEPTAPAEIAESTDRDDYEFMEFMNVSSQNIDLTGVRLTMGITFNFADNTIIPPGGRLVIVKDHAAFVARYGNAVPIATDVLGNNEYSGRLANGGEQITLLDAGDNIIHDFVYDDALPWPFTDGTGFTMVLKSPAQPIPDHGIPSNWVASAVQDGAPGQPTDSGFTGTASDDLDQDGFNALMEYALGRSDATPGDSNSVIRISSQNFFVGGNFDDYLVITFNRNLLTQNAVSLVPEISSDLVGWAENLVLVSETLNPDLTSTLQYRSATPVTDEERQFIRLKASQ